MPVCLLSSIESLTGPCSNTTIQDIFCREDPMLVLFAPWLASTDASPDALRRAQESEVHSVTLE